MLFGVSGLLLLQFLLIIIHVGPALGDGAKGSAGSTTELRRHEWGVLGTASSTFSRCAACAWEQRPQNNTNKRPQTPSTHSPET